MNLTVWVHPVDSDRFPQIPQGSWRWCVGAGDDPADVRMWLNAGIYTTADPSAWDPETSARIEGSQHGATCLSALTLAGVTGVIPSLVVLEQDPCSDDAYDQPLTILEEL